MLRRDVPTILAAHRLDPSKRELYVEGSKDALFLRFLAELPAEGGGQVVPIDNVELPGVPEGGNRSRVVKLGRAVVDAGVSIRGLVDADNDLLIPQDLPHNVWKTDGRDLDSYLLRPDCFEKLGLAGGFGADFGREVLDSVVETGRVLGALRIASARESLELPFQTTDIRKAVDVTGSGIEFNLQRYTGVLLQNAGRSRRETADLCAVVHQIVREFQGEDPIRVVSGKDALALLDAVLRPLKRDIGAATLRSTFERSMVASYPTLTDIVSYLSGS